MLADRQKYEDKVRDGTLLRHVMRGTSIPPIANPLPSVDSPAGRGDWSPNVPGQGVGSHLFGE